jgi:hypothetical protein
MGYFFCAFGFPCHPEPSNAPTLSFRAELAEAVKPRNLATLVAFSKRSTQHSYRCPSGKDFSTTLRFARNDKEVGFFVVPKAQPYCVALRSE